MYERACIHGTIYMDTMGGRHKSLDGNKYAQVFANDSFFAVSYPMDKKSSAGQALKQFIGDFGIPDRIVCDGLGEQMGKRMEFAATVRKHGIDIHLTEPDCHNQSKVEGVICELCKRWFRVMQKQQVPSCLWDYGIRWVCKIMQCTASNSGCLQGRTPLEQLTGETPNISEYLDFSFYDWCSYNDNASVGETKLGRWLGVSHHVGSLMSYWVLMLKGHVISWMTVSQVTNLEKQQTDVKHRLAEFDSAITARFNDDANILVEGGKIQLQDWSEPVDDLDFLDEFHNVISNPEVPEVDQQFTPDVFDDRYLNMELALPHGDEATPQYAKVTKRLRDANGIPIGTADDNPILDTRMYKVEFMDGTKQSLSANYIAENVFAQVDQDGNHQVLLHEIIDYCTTGKEVKQQDAFITTRTGTKRRHETTIGWELLVQWKDGSTNWVALKDLKESYPVQVAEYSVGARISMEPAFAWWVPYMLKKHNRIVAKVKSKYWIRTHKFGVRIPKSVQEAKELDHQNGNNLWWEAICKEMKNVRLAFEVWEKDVSQIPPRYQQIKCHMVFDVKMGENFCRKAQFVVGSRTTETPSTLTYSSVVSRDSVRIILLVAALNGLNIMACDIQNAYLRADCNEKIWTIAGPEFRSEKGMPMIIRKALYGLKSSGAVFRAHLAETLYDISYRSSKVDPDVWLRPAVKPNGQTYYEYILCYVDDILSVSLNATSILKSIQVNFKLKDDKIEPPSDYLSAVLGQMDIDGKTGWYLSSEKYVKSAIENVEQILQKSGQKLPSKCKTPLSSLYRPELDTSPELEEDGLQHYQELIGVLRWAVELG